MNSIKKLAGQTAIYGVSSIAARLLNYMLTPYLTRLMTREEYGVVTDVYALIPFALVVLTMGLESGYFKFAGKGDSGKNTDSSVNGSQGGDQISDTRGVFRTTWGSTIAAAGVFAGLVSLFHTPLQRITGYTPELLWMTVGIIVLDVVTAIPFARLRQQGRATRFVAVRVTSVLINVGLCVFFYSALRKTGAQWVFVANLAASAAALIMVMPKTAPVIEWRTLKPILLYSLPLLIGGIAGTANEFIDRQMIKYLMPAGEAMGALGVYGAVVKIGVVLLLFTQMYRMAAEPFFLSNFKKEDFVQTNAQAMKYFIIVSVAIFLGITLFADWFGLLIGRDFRQGMGMLPVVLLSNILSGVVLNLSFWYKQYGRTKFAIVVTGTGLVFTVIFNILLVPRLGYFGAALARLACEAAMVGISWWLNRHHCPTPYPARRIGEYILLGAVIYGAGFITAEMAQFPKYFLNFALFGGYLFYSLWREKLWKRIF